MAKLDEQEASARYSALQAALTVNGVIYGGDSNKVVEDAERFRKFLQGESNGKTDDSKA